MKCALYCRLSEEDRNKQKETDDSNSIQNQKSMLIQYAMDNGWEIYGIYSDDDYTGSDRNRPEFNRLLVDAENKKFDIIICKTQSRFTRELELVEKYINYLFPIWGIRFIGVVDNADTDIIGNKKTRQINGLVNEWYLEDLSDSIKSVLDNRRENGFHIGAFALYGYQKDPNLKGHLIIDEEAAKIVKEVFSLFSQGYGKTNIARVLNERGIPNPTEYKRLKGLRWRPPKGKHGTLWGYYAIADMLCNEIYIGNMVQGKYGSVSYKSKVNKPKPKEQWIRVENTHEPIIDRDLWNRVQELIKQKAKPFVIGEIGLFAKKTYCMYCGYTLRSSKSHGYHYLKCARKHISNDSCIGAFIPVRELETIVLQELKKLCNDIMDIEHINKEVIINNDLTNTITKLNKSIKDYEIKKFDCMENLKSLYTDKVKGLISEQNYIMFSKEFENDKEKYQSIIEDYQKQIETYQSKMKSMKDRKEIIQEYVNVNSLTREMVDTLIDKIYIGKRNNETKELPIEIIWNF
ncbi:MAG: recombinase family protein [Bacilli bacterium]